MFFMIPTATKVGESGFQKHACPVLIRHSYISGLRKLIVSKNQTRL